MAHPIRGVPLSLPLAAAKGQVSEMKTIYRGFEIDVRRERCLGGWDMLYFDVVRLSDGWILESSCEDSAEKVRDQVGYMKHRVDNYLLNPECENIGGDWGQHDGDGDRLPPDAT